MSESDKLIVGRVVPAQGPPPKINFKDIKTLLDDKKREVVDHPTHYNAGEFEAIDVIADAGFGEGFCLGNALKYILRARHKENYTEDLEKAAWYLNYWLDNKDRWHTIGYGGAEKSSRGQHK